MGKKQDMPVRDGFLGYGLPYNNLSDSKESSTKNRNRPEVVNWLMAVVSVAVMYIVIVLIQ